ncbi:hypothetical protein F66182_8906 [Fusarium sp. NRRL 66182]|nr:hypothetical protein F66182_8906 [Fusarium sp. NRRL 66182]
MTVYSISNRSIEAIDPLKQAGQLPSYDTTEAQQAREHRQQTPEPSAKKETVGGRFHKVSSKAGSPLNKAANLFGAEGWWPSTMDKECNKAARILHSFTNLGSSTSPNARGPFHPTGLTRKSMVKIPPSVLQRAAGLAIFNLLRAGACHGSLAGGSGIVIARRSDGTWSPPSSFVVSTLGAGFAFGLDVYECVCVLNTPAQVAAFTKPRLSLGAEGSIAVGPVGTGGSVEAALSKTTRPMWSYMKSRGLWASLQVDGTIVVTRGDANATFYNERGITADKILRGDVAWPQGARPLFEVLRALEGRADYDPTVVRAVGEAERQERYLDGPDAPVQETREQPTVEEPNVSRDMKGALPDYKEARPEDEKEEKEETVIDEKAKLAASGN